MPRWLRKTKIVKKLNKMLVNHLGLTLAKEDLQNVVDLMEPYGQISNGIELLSPPHDVRNYHLHNVCYMVNFPFVQYPLVSSLTFFLHFLIEHNCNIISSVATKKINK